MDYFNIKVIHQYISKCFEMVKSEYLKMEHSNSQ